MTMNIRLLSRAFLMKCKPAKLAAASGAAGMMYFSCYRYSTTQQEDQSRSNSINDSCSFPLNKVTFPSLQYNTTAVCEPIETEEQRFQRMLSYHRERIGQYRKEWEYRADGNATTATKTPSRSWPDNVPSNDDLPSMLEDMKYCSRSPNSRSDKEEYCHRLNFRVASALLLQYDEESQKKGMDILRRLAETGYSDAMAYYGICLNEGRAGLDPNAEAAVSWWQLSMDRYLHPQSVYELAVAKYTGEGVSEDEVEAVRLFALAAEQDHPAAAYMLGDCMLDGIGVEMDRGAALVWLVRASELGHRGARSRVMAVLEKKDGEDYGDFTDASRQTFVEHTLFSADKDGHIIQRTATIRKKIGGDIGGGPSNPTELHRRRTIVGKSRNT
ncbi:Sel1-like repeat family protein [Skeletonema marinoi]|uniref:Sel1-like repeat family protein n=1 Tax=Skeletonema marinoi TaxID=267567 RepID=A0AAD8Y986_9STRA|nr:Sel1-like repeat family protein [Skeletonema marinoi]